MCVCESKLHSEHTEKTCFTGVLVTTSLRTHWKKHALLVVCWVELHSDTHWKKTCFTGVCESKLHSDTLKNMLYWCCWVKLHSELTEKTCFTGVCSQTSLRTH